MSFKEKFQKYLNGELPQEEADKLQEEVEKVQVIIEYIDEDLISEEKIFSEKAPDEIKNHEKEKDFSKEINKAVNRKLRRISVAVGVLILVIVLIIMYGPSPLKKSMYYDPSETLGDYYQAIDLPMAIYTELHIPFNWYDGSFITDEGNGKYSIDAFLQFNGELKYFNFIMNKGIFEKIPMDWYGLNLPVNAFTRSENIPEEHSANRSGPDSSSLEYVIEELQELPSVARVYSAISFKEDMSFQEVLDFQKEYDIYISYIPVRIPNGVSFEYYGVEPTGVGKIFEEKAYDKDGYPYLELSNYSGEKTGEVLEVHLKSMLSYLIEEEQLLKAMDMPSEDYKRVLDFIENEGVKSYGAAIYASAEETIKILEDERVEGIYIHDIKLSSYSK
ncbi:MAG: anti sigma factor C-terminal domain-containing protein [Clostridiaceae bacterium]